MGLRQRSYSTNSEHAVRVAVFAQHLALKSGIELDISALQGFYIGPCPLSTSHLQVLSTTVQLIAQSHYADAAMLSSIISLNTSSISAKVCAALILANCSGFPCA